MNKKLVDDAINDLLMRSKAFHERYFRAYGQIILRLDEDTYLMSNDNLRLAKLKESDFGLFDINTGDIGTILRSLPDINAIVFMCTEASVFFSEKGATLNSALDDLAQIIGPDVPTIPDANASTLIRVLKQRSGCFIKGAGIIATGPDMDAAIATARIMEKCAEVELYADKLGGVKYLTQEQTSKLKSFGIAYFKANSDPKVDFVCHSPEEFKMRSRMIDVGKALCNSDLIQGTWGNISMRLDENTMLITPSGMKYYDIRMEDIVRLDLDELDWTRQRKPSSEYKLHAGIYKAHPECNAVIHTHSNGCSVFAAANAGFRIETPELQDIIGDLHVSEYAHPGTDELTDAVMKALEGSHACIIANHGALFYSHSIDLALAIANAVEDRACNLLGFGTSISSLEDDDN